MKARVAAFVAMLGAMQFGCNSEVKAPPSVINNDSVRAPQESLGPPLFSDITEQSGIRMVYRNGEEAENLAILESLGGGVGVLDYDGDGLPDLFFTGGGRFEGPDKKNDFGLAL